MIVTSSLFTVDPITGICSLDWDKLKEFSQLVGQNRLVIDLSCRRKPIHTTFCISITSSSTSGTTRNMPESEGEITNSSSNRSEDDKLDYDGEYYVVVNKWSTFTNLTVT